MKKLMMMAVMAAAATTAFAQADLVKQAQKLCDKGELEQAITTITPALENGSAEEKAAAWNTMSNIQYQIYMKGQQQEVENKVKQTTTPYDTAGMNRAIVAALEAAIQCDKYDIQPNEKGKVKMKYRAENQKKYQALRPTVINSGMYEYNHKNMEGAIKAWKLYIDSAEDPLFTGLDMTQDPYKTEIAYYVGLASYQIKDYETAKKYAQIAAADPKKEKEAGEILLFAQKDACKTKEDTLAFVQTLKEMRKKDPSEMRYFNMLSEIYASSRDRAAMAAWCDEEIALDPTNKMPWALKGEALMQQSKWDEAIEAYKKAYEIDPSFVQVIFNIGVCLNSKAIELKDKLADKNTGGLTKANADKVKAVLNESKGYLEKTKELDPNREKCNWAYPLYQIYYSLGDQTNAAEMEKLLGNK